MSAGAMQYHFKAKIDAIKAAIGYLYEKRLADRDRDAGKIKGNPLIDGVAIYWNHLNQDYFVAYQELVIAARTHPDLSSALKPAYQDFIVTYREQSEKQFPIWAANSEKFSLVADLIQYVLEGLAYGRLNDQISDEKTQKLLHLTTQLAKSWSDQNFTKKSDT